MGYKDIVKDLVGGGLNAYHQKAKETVSRIKEQNVSQTHKINALVNSFDDDYITKKEEGSVISLEHSKEGMVFIDEFEGNTLVNYCQEGEAELTLNGDIDVEGTFVTTTECVGDGKVDVACEGDTLVNLIQVSTSIEKPIVAANLGSCRLGSASLFKNGVTYTVICEFSEIVGSEPLCLNFNNGASAPDIRFVPKLGKNVYCFTMPATPIIGLNANVGAYYFDEGHSCKIKNLIILEGDYTNKPIPTYFEGMKSVGELEGNKLEVVSNNKNLIDKTKYFNAHYSFGIPVKSNDGPLTGATINGNSYTSILTGSYNKGIGGIIKVNKNKDYTLSIENINLVCEDIETTAEVILLPLHSHEVPNVTAYPDHAAIGRFKYSRSGNAPSLSVTLNSGNYDYMQYYIGGSYRDTVSGKVTLTYDNPQLECNNVKTTYVEGVYNSKNINLSAPLRGLPNGVRDKFVKMSNKWYVERNCGIDGSLHLRGWTMYALNEECPDVVGFYSAKNEMKIHNGALVCDVFKCYEIDVAPGILTINEECMSGVSGGIAYYKIIINRNKLTSLDISSFTKWLETNRVNIVYPLATPTYEEITDPSLITYLDTTHISNNSTIPCNMKVKNTGYNAIIKPSTQYTVALDTDKVGTIGINLGGAKVTTANNVALVTTPATLADDSLRIGGKGLKSKNVRLLEGNKTNWIPAMFNGMLSCFEGKDNNVELKMVNGNLIDNDECWETIGSHGIVTKDGCDVVFDCNGSANAYGAKMVRLMKLEPNTSYFFGAEWEIIRGATDLTRPFLRIHMPNTASYFGSRAPSFSFTTDATGFIRVMLYIDTPSQHDIAVKFKQIKLSKISAPYTPHQSNSTQFQLQEPLRGIGNVKDRLVLVDGVPMIERNCGKVVLDGSKVIDADNGLTNTYRCSMPLPYAKDASALLNDSIFIPIISGTSSVDSENMQITGGQLYIRILKSKLTTPSVASFKAWLQDNPVTIVCQLAEPTYEPFDLELQEIILEGYENGTLFLDTIIPPTAGLRYAGEVAISSTVKHNATSIDYTTHEINENMIPYIMDMDYRVLLLSEEQPVAKMQVIKSERLIPMLKREISTGRYSKEEYLTRLKKYQETGRITDTEYVELEEILNEH